MAIADFFRKRQKDALRQAPASTARLASTGRQGKPAERSAVSVEATDKRGTPADESIKPTIQVAGKTKYHWRKDIIWEPVITEKTRRLSQAGNTVTFKISPRANRSEIKEAVEKIFNVKVEKVRTELVKRRERGRTRIRSVRPTFKKAYVTLRSGSRIALFE